MRISDGKSIPYTPGSAVAAGTVVVQGNLIGIATEPIPAGKLGALQVEGIFEVDRVGAILGGLPAGRKVYWDESNQHAHNTPGASRKLLGKTVESTSQIATRVRVKLTQ